LTEGKPSIDEPAADAKPTETTLLRLAGWSERRGRLKGVALLALTVLVLTLLLTRIEVAAVLQAMARLPLGSWLAAAAITAILPLTMTTRWRLVLGATGVDVPWRRCLVIVLGVHPISIVSPARLGDALRAYGLRRQGAGATALGGILAERALDISILAAGAGLSALISGRAEIAWIAGLVLLAVILVLGLAGRADRLPLKPRWRDSLGRFAAASEVFRRRPGTLLAAVAITLLHWGLTMALVTLLLRGVGAEVGIGDVTAAMPIAIFVGLLPITIGGIGTRDAALVALLAGLAAPAECLAASLLYTLFVYVFVALAGLPLTRRALDL
jgi:uncharacterized membrane protein YbhN (UPF0104 family)